MKLIRNYYIFLSDLRKHPACSGQAEKKPLKNVKTFHFKVGDEVLKANKRKEGRKGGKPESNWSGPFYISSISEKGVATLTTMKGPQLKQSVNVSQLKPFIKSNSRGNIINIESQFK